MGFGQIAVIIIYNALLRDLAKRRRQGGLGKPRTCHRDGATKQIGVRKSRNIFQPVNLICDALGLVVADRKACLGMMDRMLKKARQGYGVDTWCSFESSAPPIYRSRNSQRGLSAAGGDCIGETCGLIPHTARQRGRVAPCKNRLHRGIFAFDQPKPIAADPVHMWIGHGDGCGHGHHRFNGAASLGENILTCLRGQMMRGCHGTPKSLCGVKHGLSLVTR